MAVQSKIVITGTSTITAIGHDSGAVAMAIRANAANLEEYDAFFDVSQNPIIAARIEGVGEEKEDKAFVEAFSRACFADLLDAHFGDRKKSARDVCLILGVAPQDRPGLCHGDFAETLQREFTMALNIRGFEAAFRKCEFGNPSAVYGMVDAREVLNTKPDAICILGCFDSLLELKTLEWFEEGERLKSVTAGRNQGFSPSQGVGFMVIESEKSALINNRKILATIQGIATDEEPAPFLSDAPSRGIGLTKAVTSALSQSGCTPEAIDHVLCDLNGEFYRSREWGYVENRVFGGCANAPSLIHPADCMGSLGAASGAVLVNVAAMEISAGEMGERVLVFCCDDDVYRGAVVLSKYDGG